MEKLAICLVYRQVKDDSEMCLDGSLPAKRSKAWSAVQGALVQQSKKPRWILFIQHLCIVIDKCTVLCKFLLKCWLCCPLADCIFPLTFAVLSVNILRLCLKAEELSSDPELKASLGWYTNWKCHHAISLRAKTTLAQHLPADMEEKVIEFHCLNRAEILTVLWLQVQPHP